MDGARDGYAGGQAGQAPTTGPSPDREDDSPKAVVLLVEDTEADREVYGELLWYNGYEVVHALDGEEALSKAESQAPDLVLLDMRLPGELDGLAVARRLRGRGVTVPIVGLSARPADEFGPAIEEAGIDAYLEKPIDPYAVVREVMRRIGHADGKVRRAEPEG
jgi:two-component system, OmpR family, response regulator MprA